MGGVTQKKLVALDAWDVSPFAGHVISGRMMHTNVCAEYFAYIKYLCIQGKYKEAFQTSDVGEEYDAFQTFIQQSHEYYLLAEKGSFQVAPLCYYYSFLNLMKAYLAPKHWRKRKEYFAHHGLRPKKDKNKVVSDYLIIDKGVFSLAIDDITQSTLYGTYNKREMNIKEMIWYLPGIEVEITELYNSRPRYFPVRCNIVLENNLCDIRLAANRLWQLAKQYPLPSWSLRGISPNLRDSFMNTSRKGNVEWTYELRKKLKVVDGNVENNICVFREIERKIGSLAPLWDFSTTMGDRNLLLIPYSRDFVLPVEVVILGVMYYLSQLVRYRPYELERLRYQDPNLIWLYECFVRNSTVKYYQLLCSRLHRKYIEFSI